jgi:GTP cyclohydrolase I
MVFAPELEQLVPLDCEPLAPSQDESRPDLAAAADAVRALLVALGQDPDSEGLSGTSRRVAAAYAELLTPEPFEFTSFRNDSGYRELVLVRDITFRSLCEHHLLPFHGVAHVGYLPDQRVVGLSKLARVVHHFASRLQVQERLTEQVADFLAANLRTQGVAVVLEARHECMALRGVRSPRASTTTSAFHGRLRTDRSARAEFFSLIHSAR